MREQVLKAAPSFYAISLKKKKKTKVTKTSLKDKIDKQENLNKTPKQTKTSLKDKINKKTTMTPPQKTN